VRWRELRRLFDADLGRDRADRLCEPSNRLLGFEDVDDAETVLAFSGEMNQQAPPRLLGVMAGL